MPERALNLWDLCLSAVAMLASVVRGLWMPSDPAPDLSDDRLDEHW